MSQTILSHSSTPEFNRTTTPPSVAPLFSKFVLLHLKKNRVREPVIYYFNIFLLN